MNQNVTYVEQPSDFERMVAALQQAEWFGFDTEFVGEKTYVPVLCLLQIISGDQIYLVDTLKIKELQSFLSLVAEPSILKITHAGDNDYRLLYTLYGTIPSNTFDTQIAAGFAGHNYPAGFSKIVERELRVSLSKSHTVANWEARPLDPKALKYAVEDVQYLPALHQKLSEKLRKKGRTSWAREENRKWENPAFYIVDPNKEVMSNDYILQLNPREQLFLSRLFRWRRERAMSLNVPKELALQSRHISNIVKAMKDGANATRANRTLPENMWRKHYAEWEILWTKPASPEEQTWIDELPNPTPEDALHEWNMELCYHLVRRQCMEHEISPALLLPRGDFNRLKAGSSDFDQDLLKGWRAELLGKPLVNWLCTQHALAIHWDGDNKCILEMTNP